MTLVDCLTEDLQFDDCTGRAPVVAGDGLGVLLKLEQS